MGRGCLDGFGEQEIVTDRRGDPLGSTSERSWREWSSSCSSWRSEANISTEGAERATGESGRATLQGCFPGSASAWGRPASLGLRNYTAATVMVPSMQACEP